MTMRLSALWVSYSSKTLIATISQLINKSVMIREDKLQEKKLNRFCGYAIANVTDEEQMEVGKSRRTGIISCRCWKVARGAFL